MGGWWGHGRGCCWSLGRGSSGKGGAVESWRLPSAWLEGLGMGDQQRARALDASCCGRAGGLLAIAWRSQERAGGARARRVAGGGGRRVRTARARARIRAGRALTLSVCARARERSRGARRCQSGVGLADGHEGPTALDGTRVRSSPGGTLEGGHACGELRCGSPCRQEEELRSLRIPTSVHRGNLSPSKRPGRM